MFDFFTTSERKATLKDPIQRSSLGDAAELPTLRIPAYGGDQLVPRGLPSPGLRARLSQGESAERTTMPDA